jgi:hypothetical protein
MNDVAPSKLTDSAAVLLFRDVVAAANHYRDAMGFDYGRFYGEPPGFVILFRDDLYLMLKQAEAKLIAPHRSVDVETCDVYFWTSGVDVLHAEFVRRGARICDGLCLQDYGCKEFAVQDLDGHEIRFGQVVAEGRT